MKNKRKTKQKRWKTAFELLKQRKSDEGITLIALVVTIVVLLILAGVSINLVIGNNGIINKAVEAKEQTEQAKVNEQTVMDNLYDEIKTALGELPSTTETIPYFPSDDFAQVAGTNLDNGLVIEDDQGNQYVWIEVPKTEDVYQTAGLEISTFTDAECATIHIRYSRKCMGMDIRIYDPYGSSLRCKGMQW